ncbi:MAG: hypothetical protein OEP95_01565 [Myxococcales bacterium]|nr:hypothetical protein [Myxococcales bacterium]
MDRSPEIEHARVLGERAAEIRTECEALESRAAGPSERLLRRLELLRQAVVRKGREIIQEHWDIGLFDVGFGSIKAFLIYPALFFADLGWWIPVAEVGPLNTQIWTAGYLLLRGEWLSYRGIRRYGRPLKVLDAHRNEALGLRPPDASGVHRFEWNDRRFVLRIRRNRIRHAWERFREGRNARNVLLQRELRALAGDDFNFEVNPHRNNAPLYERILLSRILAHPTSRERLLARLSPEPELGDEGRALRERIGEQGTDLAVARVVAAGDRLVAALRESLGTGFSATAMSLRWIHWSYQRHIYGLLAAEDRAVYALLSSRLGAEESGVERGAARRQLARLQAESGPWIAAMERFGADACAARGELEVREVVSAGIRDARERGLTVRLARLARAVSPTQWRLAARPADPVAPPDWGRLEALEAELGELWSEIERSGQGYEGVLRELAKDEGAARPEQLQAASLVQAEFLERLDDHLRVLHAAHVQQVRADLGRAIQQVFAFYGRRRSRGLRREHQRVERLGREYLELEPLYGTPRDHQRIACFQRFHAQAVSFSRKLRALDPTAPPVPSLSLGDRLSRLGRALQIAASRAGAALRGLGEFAAALRLVLSKPGGAEGTPFTRRVDGLFRALGELRGLAVEVRGRELLDPPPAEGEVRLLTPAHRHGVTDNVTFAALGLPDYLVFNAVDQLPVLPAWLKDRIAATPGLIAVGGGRGPAVDRALEALAEGRSRNLLIYPEGSVSEGLRATRPVRPGFGAGLVTRLLEAGQRVRITPVTYLDNARFLDLVSRSRDAATLRRRVVVSPSLAPAAVAHMVRACGGESLGRLVRMAWLESLVTDDALWLGTERARGLRRRLDAELEGARYWGSLEPAPVPDHLVPVLGSGVVTVADEPFFGRRVRVLRLPDDACDDTGSIPLENLRDQSSQELILGIRAPAHIYLNVGSQRFDGDIFRPLRVREKDSIYRGIAIRFVGVPERSLQTLRAELERLLGRERRTLTCSHSACMLIARAANLRIADHADLRPMLPSHVLPSRTIRKLIERGVLDHLGRRVEAQIYKAEDKSLEEILHEMKLGERKIMRDHVDGATAGATRWVRERISNWRG